jgi:hypothetical protein
MWVDCVVSSADAHGATHLVALTHDGGALYGTSPSAAHGLFPHLRVQSGRTAILGITLYQAPSKVHVSSQDADTYVWDSSNFKIAIGQDINSAVREYRFQVARPYINAALTPNEAHGLTIATGGSLPFAFDAALFTELGFCYPPQASADYVTTSGSGGSIAAGSYQWAVTYEFTDSAGLKHQSAPYFSGVKTTTGSTSKADLVVPSLKMTTKQDREFSDGATRIVVWRTLAADPSTFYRVLSAVNNPEAPTVTITDTFSDGTISASEILYTSRGELANECPPCMWHATAFAGKLAYIDAEYRNRIGFSKPFSAERGIEFSSASQTIVSGIGDLTALAEMDGTLYSFSATGIAAAAWGAGIDAAGQGSWPEPQIITRACGCIDPRSLCVTQDGVVFVSRQGKPATDTGVDLRIWLLPRGGGNPIEIGHKVRRYLSNLSLLTEAGLFLGPIDVTSCVNWVDGGRVCITLRTTGTSSSFQLEYDYVNRGSDGLGVWNSSYSAAYDVNGGVASTVVARGHHWLCAFAGIGRSSDSSYEDAGGVYVQYLVRFHDIKPSMIPFGKLNQITTTFETDGDNEAGIQVELSENAAASFPHAHAFVFTATTPRALVQRTWQPPTRRSSTGLGYGLQIKSLIISGEGAEPDTADVVPRAVSIDYIPLRGTHRPMAAERA